MAGDSFNGEVICGEGIVVQARPGADALRRRTDALPDDVGVDGAYPSQDRLRATTGLHPADGVENFHPLSMGKHQPGARASERPQVQVEVAVDLRLYERPETCKIQNDRSGHRGLDHEHR